MLRARLLCSPLHMSRRPARSSAQSIVPLTTGLVRFRALRGILFVGRKRWLRGARRTIDPCADPSRASEASHRTGDKARENKCEHAIEDDGNHPEYSFGAVARTRAGRCHMRTLLGAECALVKAGWPRCAGLGDNELLAIVVGSGSRRANALTLANHILETTGGLHGMPRTSVDELRRLNGMGTAKAAQVLAAVELGRRTLLRCPPARLQFVNPRDAAAYLLPQFGARPVEQFGLMMLDTKTAPLTSVCLRNAGSSPHTRVDFSRGRLRRAQPRLFCSTTTV